MGGGLVYLGLSHDLVCWFSCLALFGRRLGYRVRIAVGVTVYLLRL